MADETPTFVYAVVDPQNMGAHVGVYATEDAAVAAQRSYWHAKSGLLTTMGGNYRPQVVRYELGGAPCGSGRRAGLVVHSGRHLRFRGARADADARKGGAV